MQNFFRLPAAVHPHEHPRTDLFRMEQKLHIIGMDGQRRTGFITHFIVGLHMVKMAVGVQQIFYG